MSLGGKVGGFIAADAMHVVGDTQVFIKCSNFNNVILSTVVLRNLSQQVIVGMNFLRDNYLNLDLTPDHAHLIHTPTRQYQVLVAQISEPSIPPSRSRSEKKLVKGGQRACTPQGGSKQSGPKGYD